MLEHARRTVLGALPTLRAWWASLAAAAATTRWRGVNRPKWTDMRGEELIRLRNYGLAVTLVAAVTLASLAFGLHTAGPLIVVDVTIAIAAWFGGLSAGAAATLTAVLVARLAAGPLAGAAFDGALAVLVLGKWLTVAAVAAALSARVRTDGERISGLEDRIRSLQSEAREVRRERREVEETSARANARLRDDADLARQQLTTLQSVTDPALNVLSGAELATALLDRLRVALDADGVAIYDHQGMRGRVFSASGGVVPSGGVRRRQPASAYQTGRATLIHNDGERVAETSLCQWPADVASLILVPIVHAGRLQLVVEVANRRARRSTEWELALIQVVAERAAGLLRSDANLDTGAVA